MRITYLCVFAKRKMNKMMEEPEAGFQRPIEKRRINYIVNEDSSRSPSGEIPYHQMKRSSSEEKEGEHFEMDRSEAEEVFSSSVKRKMNGIMSESNCSVASGTEAAFRCPALQRKVDEIIGESVGIVSSEVQSFSCGKRKINEISLGESSCAVSPGVNNIKNNHCSNKNNNSEAIGPIGGEVISEAVAKVLEGYDWSLVPVATK